MGNAVGFEVFAKLGRVSSSVCRLSGAPRRSRTGGSGLGSCRSRIPKRLISPQPPSTPAGTGCGCRRARRCRGDAAAGVGGGTRRSGRRHRSEEAHGGGRATPRRETSPACPASGAPPAAIAYYRRASGGANHSDIIPRTPMTLAPGAVRDVSA